jgi:hypothetical protein
MIIAGVRAAASATISGVSHSQFEAFERGIRPARPSRRPRTPTAQAVARRHRSRRREQALVAPDRVGEPRPLRPRFQATIARTEGAQILIELGGGADAARYIRASTGERFRSRKRRRGIGPERRTIACRRRVV